MSIFSEDADVGVADAPTSPAQTRRKVLFPEPLPPTTAAIWPARTVNETPERTVRRP
ncbi:hypothetical protein QOZ89_22370 [Pseudofrankia sp. BMG5.37]|nr:MULTISPECIES: hypothetical protein [unclassified Pseudofrankia]MDT3442315.1 hypothetical protein [Pseudofrankia sp. BMG5.37]